MIKIFKASKYLLYSVIENSSGNIARKSKERKFRIGKLEYKAYVRSRFNKTSYGYKR